MVSPRRLASSFSHKCESGSIILEFVFKSRDVKYACRKGVSSDTYLGIHHTFHIRTKNSTSSTEIWNVSVEIFRAVYVARENPSWLGGAAMMSNREVCYAITYGIRKTG